MHKRLAVAVIGAIVVISPIFASAQSTDSSGSQTGTSSQQLLALYESLLQQLEQEIANLEGSQTGSTLSITGASASATVAVGNGTSQSVSFTATPTSGTAPLSVTFNASGLDVGGVPSSDTINFGDGSTSPCYTAGCQVSHTYQSAGTYTATLLTSSGGALSTATITVSGEQKNISFTATPTSGTAPLGVGFSASGLTAGQSYFVNFGDGTTGSLNVIPPPCSANPNGVANCPPASGNVSHTYGAAGTYTATLTGGMCSCPANGICNCPNLMILGTATVTVASSGSSSQSEPTITTFQASPSSVQAGQTTTVSYAVTNMGANDYCQVLPQSAFVNNNNPSHPGNQGANWSGSFSTGPLTTTTTLTLSCGGSVSQSITVAVTAQPVLSCTISASLLSNGNYGVTWTSQDAASAQLSPIPGMGSGLISVGVQNSDAESFMGNTAGPYTLTVFDGSGNQATCTSGATASAAPISNPNLAASLVGLQASLQELLAWLK